MWEALARLLPSRHVEGVDLAIHGAEVLFLASSGIDKSVHNLIRQIPGSIIRVPWNGSGGRKEGQGGKGVEGRSRAATSAKGFRFRGILATVLPTRPPVHP